MLAEKNDFDLRKEFVDFARDVEAILSGHADVHDDNVWGEDADFLDGFEAIGSFADNGKTFLHEKRAKALPDQRVIVN